MASTTKVLWVAIDHDGKPLGDGDRVIAGVSKSRVRKAVARFCGLETFSEVKRNGWAEVKRFVLEASE